MIDQVITPYFLTLLCQHYASVDQPTYYAQSNASILCPYLEIQYSVQVVFEESLIWSMILQPILHTSTEEACEDKLAAL